MGSEQRPNPATVILTGRGKEEASVGGRSEFVTIGERINPTNKALLTESLLKRDFGVALDLAKQQVENGAAVIDVNVGAVGVSETEVLPELVSYLQEHIEFPLSLDSSSAEALEAAASVYEGRPLINSTTAEANKLSRLLHLAKAKNAAVIALLMDDKGVPDDVDGRLRIADRILSEASKVGLSLSDILIDCVVMSVGASPRAARTTLLTLRAVVQKFGAATVLGISNVSHGMPRRKVLNRCMLAVALFDGLSSAIMDPLDSTMKDAIAACHLLGGRDEMGMGYVLHCRRTRGSGV